MAREARLARRAKRAAAREARRVAVEDTNQKNENTLTLHRVYGIPPMFAEAQENEVKWIPSASLGARVHKLVNSFMHPSAQ